MYIKTDNWKYFVLVIVIEFYHINQFEAPNRQPSCPIYNYAIKKEEKTGETMNKRTLDPFHKMTCSLHPSWDGKRC